MTFDISFNPPQFNDDTYDPVKMRQFVEEVERLYSSGSGSEWGSITGTLSSQADLQAELDAKADTSHSHVAADINSEVSADGFVLTSDGAGNSDWEAVSAGSEINDLTAAVTWASIPIAYVPTGTTGSTVAIGNHTHDGIADTNLLDKSTGELITLNSSQRWEFTGDGTGQVRLSSGTDLRMYSDDDVASVIFNYNNNDYRLSNFGTRANTQPIYLNGFLDLRLDFPIKLKEQAAADTAVTAYGQLWVKTATPNELWFTPDDGNDVRIDPSITEISGKTASYSLVYADRGKTIRFTGATASKVLTIPANASVALQIGTMVGIENDGTAVMTVAITTDTLTWSKDNTTGTRTLAAGASAVIKKVTSTAWKLSGSALVT